MHRLALLFLLLPALALGGDRASTKEAEQMVHNAVAFLKKEGQAKAFAAFNDPKGPFTYRDLYIWVVDMRGIIQAHVNPEVVKKNRWDFKDPDGKLVVRDIVELAKSSGKGWTEYKYKNPDSGKIEQKVSYSERVGDVVLICGAYR